MLIRTIAMNITMTTPIKIKINLAKYVVTRPINTQMSTIASASKNRLANDFSIFLSCRISPALHRPTDKQINSQMIFANSIRLMFQDNAANSNIQSVIILLLSSRLLTCLLG